MAGRETDTKSKWILVAFLALLLFAALTAHASAWYSSDWNYRKELTINNTGSELTDYQIMFTINRDTGSDSGTTVYVGTHCEEDYDDIRFIAADDSTAYNLWIESYSSSTANVWVNFTSLPTGDTTAYLYYGNSGASAVSDGDATFPFFDHFDGDALDTDKWYKDTSGTVSQSGSIVTLSGDLTDSLNGITSKSTFDTESYIFGWKVTAEGANYAHVGATDRGVGANPQNQIVFREAVGVKQYQVRKADSYGMGALAWSLNTRLELRRNGTTTYYYGNGILIDDISDATHTPTISLGAGLITTKTTNYISADWVFVRKYTATEPTIPTWGSEEEASPKSLIPDFTGTPTSGGLPLTVYFTDTSTANNCTIDTWQWAFGDSTSNSTAQNPAHTYTTTGLYDVILTITNTSFSLTNSTIKTDYINVTSGGATPTPTTTTPTPTVTGGGNVTEGNITYIYAPDQEYVPFPIWLAIVIVSIGFFGHSLIFTRNADITAVLAVLFAFVSAWLSNMIGYVDVQVTYVSEEILISPVIQASHPPWLVYTMLIFAFVSLVNIFAAIYKVYIKPVPWNEIYNRKLPRWRNRR